MKLKECFNSLDEDGSGSIGVDEIKGPLIGLGLVDTVVEVENLCVILFVLACCGTEAYFILLVPVILVIQSFNPL